MKDRNDNRLLADAIVLGKVLFDGGGSGGGGTDPFYTAVQEEKSENNYTIVSTASKTFISWTADSADAATVRGLIFDSGGANVQITYVGSGGSGSEQVGLCQKDANLIGVIGSGTGRINYYTGASGAAKTVNYDSRYYMFAGVYGMGAGSSVTLIIEKLS